MRKLTAICLLTLAACAAPREDAPQPAAAAPVDDGVVRIASVKDNVIRVTGAIADQDALAPLHCAAAKQARDLSAVTLEWVGGVAKPRGEGYAADMVYEAAADGASISLGGDAKPADGGPVPVENWMIYCDEAGIPREGQA